jgi:pSer/pThr/pTyr-binding forkhead associated (FHA) protein/DNA-directed RNA polymerase subunit RPC12/RpoP
MDALTTGTFVGAGSFRCENCGYALTLEASQALTDCPACGSDHFVRASLFGEQSIPTAGAQETGTLAPDTRRAALIESPAAGHSEKVAQARRQLDAPGEYLCYEESGELRTVALTREWTRIGRSLAADVRFDDPTVSRRHALIVRHADGVRLLDDRSLNGVFVNGARVDGRTLKDGDEIIVGRYRLSFISVSQDAASEGAESTGPGSTQSIG